MKRLLLISTFLNILISAYSQIRPGGEWKDTDGNFINAHGSSVVYDKGTYYWFGECRDGFHSQGISLYTSTDLQRWKNCGLVLKMQARPATTRTTSLTAASSSDPRWSITPRPANG